jgi:hypothetical protein
MVFLVHPLDVHVAPPTSPGGFAMNFSRTPSVLAAVAAAVLGLCTPAVAGNTGAASETQPVSLSNSSNPFVLIDPGTPEYAALQRLVADGLVRKHANLLKSGHSLTRYEAAIIAAEAINNAKRLMRASNSAQLSADDVAALRIVYDDVKDNLTALTARVSADETRIAALETAQGKQLAQATANPSPGASPAMAPSPEATTFKPSFELHGEFRIRPVLSSSVTTSATDLTGVAIPNGTNVIRTGTQGDATLTTGSSAVGAMQSRMRLVGAGHIASNADFIVRLSTEDTGGAANASLVHNDFSFVQYAVPNSPITLYGGKLLYCCGTPWLPDGTGLIADAVPIGMAVKYTAANDPMKFSGWLSAGSLKNAESDVLLGPPFDTLCPANLTQNIYAGHVEATLASNWKLQGQALDMPQQCVSAVPSGKGLLVNTADLWLASFTIDHQFSTLFSGTFELLGRLGNDPATGTGWTDNGAWLLGFKYGHFSSYGSGIDATYIDAGKNSIPGSLDSIINGVDSPWNFALPYPNNVRTFDIGANWFYGPNALVRLEWATANLRANEAGLISPTGAAPFTPVILTGDRRSLLILTGTYSF